MTSNTTDVLGEQGRIAKRLRTYEERPQQLEMAAAVERAIAEETHLVVEAGTGVGKSLAYLVPAILAVAGEGEIGTKPRKPLIISTHTISLQEQLFTRDIPFLKSVLPVEFSFVLAKGRSNYISLRRLSAAVDRAQSTFFQEKEFEQLRSILDWSKVTNDGSRSDLDFKPLPNVWDEVASDRGNCLGKKCPTHKDCFYYQARRRAWNADVLIVNHALFLSDLGLRREGASLLPDYDVVILDEAHTLEAVAGEHLGLSLTSGQFDFLLAKLYNDRTQRGLLVHHKLVEGMRLVDQVRYAVRSLFEDIHDWQRQHGKENGRLRAPLEIENKVTHVLQQLAAAIGDAAKRISAEEQAVELTAASVRSIELGQTLSAWLKQTLADSVYWIETVQGKRPRTELHCAPIEVGPVLQAELFDRVKTAVLTSATLAVGKRSFDFVKDRLGVGRANEQRLGSPFDYKRQVRLILPRDMPDPAERPADYERAVCERIKRYVAQTRGRAFVLFTSYKMLKGLQRTLSKMVPRERLHPALPGGRTSQFVDARKVSQGQGRRPVRHRQFLAGSRRSRRRAAKRDHYEASIQRARSSLARSEVRGDSRTRRKPVRRVSGARSGDQAETGIRPSHPPERRYRASCHSRSANSHEAIRPAVFRQSARNHGRD